MLKDRKCQAQDHEPAADWAVKRCADQNPADPTQSSAVRLRHIALKCKGDFVGQFLRIHGFMQYGNAALGNFVQAFGPCIARDQNCGNCPPQSLAQKRDGSNSVDIASQTQFTYDQVRGDYSKIMYQAITIRNRG